MGANRFWYREGEIEELISSPNKLSRFMLSFGQGIHIAWRTSGTRIPFFTEQFSVLLEMLRLNQVKLNHNFDEAFLRGEITRLLNRNRIFKGALIHLLFMADKNKGPIRSSGLYMATENLSEEKFILHSRGIKLGWLKDHTHAGDWLIQGIGNYHPIHMLWEQELKQLNCDAGYFTDKNQKITECSDASLFVIQGTRLYTPSLNLGLTPRAIRKVILRLAPTLGLQVIETELLEPAHLDAADEIFLADDHTGIRWIVGHGEIRYFRKYSELFNTIINREWAAAN